MTQKSVTLVMGATDNPARYANMAVRKLRAFGHSVIAFGKRPGIIGDVAITSRFPQDKPVDTVTLYLNSSAQDEYKDMIIGLKPKRIIFNPGAENPPWMEELRSSEIEPVEACTLVMLSAGNY